MFKQQTSTHVDETRKPRSPNFCEDCGGVVNKTGLHDNCEECGKTY